MRRPILRAAIVSLAAVTLSLLAVVTRSSRAPLPVELSREPVPLDLEVMDVDRRPVQAELFVEGRRLGSTDREGRFRGEAPRSWFSTSPWRVTARAEGYTDAELRPYLPTSAPWPIDDELLVPSGRASGSIVDETGRPLAGVEVCFECADCLREGRRAAGTPTDECRRSHSRTLSDEQGSFELRRLLHGRGALLLRKQGFLDRRLGLDHVGKTTPPVAVALQPDPDSAVDVPLRVVFPDGDEDRFVRVHYGQEGEPGQISLSGLSTMDLPLFRSSTYWIEVHEEGEAFAPVRLSGVRADRRPIVATFLPARSFQVRLVGEGGAPVADATVVVRPETQPPYQWSARTSADGIASLRVPETETAELRVWALGYHESTTTLRAPVDPDDPLEIALSPRSGIRGRVLQEGSPVVKATVTFWDAIAPPDPEQERVATDSIARYRRRSRGSTTTDRLGRFHFFDEERASLEMWVSSGGAVVAIDGPVTVPSEGPALEHDIELGPAASVSGTVHAEPWLPARRVLLLGEGDLQYDVPLGPRGRFRFERVVPGPYAVRVVNRTDRPLGASYPADLQVDAGRAATFDVDLRGDVLYLAGGWSGCSGPERRETFLRRVGDEYRGEGVVLPAGRVEALRRAILAAPFAVAPPRQRADPEQLMRTAGIDRSSLATHRSEVLALALSEHDAGSFGTSLEALDLQVLAERFQQAVLVQPDDGTGWIEIHLPGDPPLALEVEGSQWSLPPSAFGDRFSWPDPIPIFRWRYGAETRQSLDPALVTAVRSFLPDDSFDTGLVDTTPSWAGEALWNDARLWRSLGEVIEESLAIELLRSADGFSVVDEDWIVARCEPSPDPAWVLLERRGQGPFQRVRWHRPARSSWSDFVSRARSAESALASRSWTSSWPSAGWREGQRYLLVELSPSLEDGPRGIPGLPSEQWTSTGFDGLPDILLRFETHYPSHVTPASAWISVGSEDALLCQTRPNTPLREPRGWYRVGDDGSVLPVAGPSHR